ncbi:MAG: hypothetical protein U0414_38965 [Polyangiaceae bacterium]
MRALVCLVWLCVAACGSATPAATSDRVDAVDVTPTALPTASSAAVVAPSASAKPSAAGKEIAKDGFCGRAVAPGAEEAYARSKKLLDILGAEGHPSDQELQHGMKDLEAAADGGVRDAEWDFGSVVFSTRFGDHAPRPDERDLYVRAFKNIRLAALRGNTHAAESFPDLAGPTLPQKLEEPLAQFARSWLEQGVKRADEILSCAGAR